MREDRDVGRAGDGALAARAPPRRRSSVASKPTKQEKANIERHAGGTAEDVGRGRTPATESPDVAAVADDDDVEDSRTTHLGDQQHAEHPRADLDVAVAEDGDGARAPIATHASQGRSMPTLSSRISWRTHRAARRCRRACSCRRAGRRTPRRSPAGRPRPARDVRGEAAGAGDVAAHRRVADREEQQDDRRDQVRAGPADAVGAEDERRGAEGRRQRRRGRDDEEDDAGGADRVALQLVVGSAGRGLLTSCVAIDLLLCAFIRLRRAPQNGNSGAPRSPSSTATA